MVFLRAFTIESHRLGFRGTIAPPWLGTNDIKRPVDQKYQCRLIISWHSRLYRPIVTALLMDISFYIIQGKSIRILERAAHQRLTCGAWRRLGSEGSEQGSSCFSTGDSTFFSSSDCCSELTSACLRVRKVRNPQTVLKILTMYHIFRILDQSKTWKKEQFVNYFLKLASFFPSTEVFFCTFLMGSFFLMGLLISILCALKRSAFFNKHNFS